MGWIPPAKLSKNVSGKAQKSHVKHNFSSAAANRKLSCVQPEVSFARTRFFPSQFSKQPHGFLMNMAKTFDCTDDLYSIYFMGMFQAGEKKSSSRGSKSLCVQPEV